MKKIFSISLVAVFLFSVVVVPAFAITTKPLDARSSSKAAEKKLARLDASMENLKERGEKEINRRLESLNKLLTRIAEFKKLSATQKAALNSQVQAEITKLNALLAKIQADTDVTTLQADVKSIVDSYRIYALFMPKIQILGASDRMLNTADLMSSQAAQLEVKINAKQTEGKNVADLLTLLADMKAKIADVKSQAQAAIDIVTPLVPEGFPDNKTSLQSARQMLVTALHNLNTARQDGRKIIVGLMKLGKITSDGPTPTPTP